MTFSDTRYDSMRYNRCGKSGLLLPAISLGFWNNFGDSGDDAEMRRILHCAFDLGITHFDFGNNYGPPPGAAERNVGRILAENFQAHRDELIISTKAGYRMWPGPYGEWGSKKYLVSSLDQSLKRLGLDYVDLFYTHRFDPHTPLEETLGALDLIVRQGKALYAGVSNYSGASTDEACRIMNGLGTPVTIHQAKYSMLRRGVETDLFPQADAHGFGIIAFCTLEQGILANRYANGIPETSRAARPESTLHEDKLDSDWIEKARRLAVIAQRRGQTMAQMAFAWTLRNPQVVSVLTGASRAEQLEENMMALNNLDFDEAELKEIEAILG